MCILTAKKLYINKELVLTYTAFISDDDRKLGELLESPEVDNQQLNLNSNIFESSTTNTQILTNNVEDGNSDTSALPTYNSGDDIV